MRAYGQNAAPAAPSPAPRFPGQFAGRNPNAPERLADQVLPPPPCCRRLRLTTARGRDPPRKPFSEDQNRATAILALYFDCAQMRAAHTVSRRAQLHRNQPFLRSSCHSGSTPAAAHACGDLGSARRIPPNRHRIQERQKLYNGNARRIASQRIAALAIDLQSATFPVHNAAQEKAYVRAFHRKYDADVIPAEEHHEPARSCRCLRT